MADRDDGRLLTGIELDDPAGSIVAEARDDHPVAGLEPRPGIGDRIGLPCFLLQLRQALSQS